MWRHSVKMPRDNKLDTLWETGVYVGNRTVSGESMVATSRGMFKTIIRRLPVETSWSEENLHFFKFFIGTSVNNHLYRLIVTRYSY